MTHLKFKVVVHLSCSDCFCAQRLKSTIQIWIITQWQFNDFCERNKISGTIELPSKVSLPKNDASITAIYRTFQESLSNIVKYPNASKVKVTLRNFDNKLMILIDAENIECFGWLDLIVMGASLYACTSFSTNQSLFYCIIH